MATMMHPPSQDEIVSEIMREMKRSARDILGESPLRPLEPLEQDNAPLSNFITNPSSTNPTSPIDYPPATTSLPNSITNGPESTYHPSNSQLQEITSPSDVRAIVNSYKSPEHFLPEGIISEILPIHRPSPHHHSPAKTVEPSLNKVTVRSKRFLPNPLSSRSPSPPPISSPTTQQRPKNKPTVQTEPLLSPAPTRDVARGRDSSNDRDPTCDRDTLRDLNSTSLRNSTRGRNIVPDRDSTRGRGPARERKQGTDRGDDLDGRVKLREKTHEKKRGAGVSKEESNGSDMEIEDTRGRHRDDRIRERRARENSELRDKEGLESAKRDRKAESTTRTRGHKSPSSSANSGADTDSDSKDDDTKNPRAPARNDESPNPKKRRRNREESVQPRRPSVAETSGTLSKRQKRSSNANLSRRNSVSGGDASAGSASNGGGGSVAASGTTSGAPRLVIKVPSNVIMGQERGSLSTKSHRKDRDDNDKANFERKPERRSFRNDDDTPRGSKRRVDRDEDDRSNVKADRKTEAPNHTGRDGRPSKRVRRERSDRDEDVRSEITANTKRRKEKDQDDEKGRDYDRPKESGDARGKERVRQKDFDPDRYEDNEKSKDKGKERDFQSHRGLRSEPIRSEQTGRRAYLSGDAKIQEGYPNSQTKRGADRKDAFTSKPTSNKREGSASLRPSKQSERRGSRDEEDESPETRIQNVRRRNVDKEDDRHHDRHRGRGMDRIRGDVRDGNRSGDRERSVRDWDGERDIKRGEKRDGERERARGADRGRDKGRTDERDRARTRDNGPDRSRERDRRVEREDDLDRGRDRERGHARNRERFDRESDEKERDKEDDRKNRPTQRGGSRRDPDAEMDEARGWQGDKHDREVGRKRGTNDVNADVEWRGGRDRERGMQREREREQGSVGLGRNRERERERGVDEGRDSATIGKEHVDPGTVGTQNRKDAFTPGKLQLRSIPPPALSKSPKVAASPMDNMTGLRSVAVPMQLDEEEGLKPAPNSGCSGEVMVAESSLVQKVELKAVRAKQAEMERAFMQANLRCDELFAKKDYDGFEELAKQAVKYYFEWALAKESELRLSENELRRMNAQEHSSKRKPVMSLYRDLAGNFVNKQVERLESINRKEAVHFFRRATQKAYLRMALLQRTWAKDMKASNDSLRRCVVDAMNRCPGASGSATLDRGKLSQVKSTIDDFANMVQIAEQVISDLGDGHEEAGGECRLC